MLEIHYAPSLVLASIAVAIMASFTTLRLTSGLGVLSAHQRKIRICKAAFALGGGIWSMHFIGMLSVQVDAPIFYDPLRTLGSALIAILLTGGALMSLHFGQRTRNRIVFAGIVTGLGIVGMHYIGMSAISGNCIVSHEPGGIVLATAIAAGACILAMELAYRKRTRIATVFGAAVLGLSITAMHYSAMMFTTFSAGAEVDVSPALTISSNSLALLLAVAAFVICGLFLLIAVPGDEAKSAVSSDNGAAEPVNPESARRLDPPAKQAGLALSRAFSGPHGREAETAEDCTRIPYERDKTIRFLSADSILFVQADGHYTRIANGEDKLFCPWSISKVEKSLKTENFIRTHRSYLVNRAHIRGFRRQGDKGICLVGTADEAEVPVSRGRIQAFQQEFGIQY